MIDLTAWISNIDGLDRGQTCRVNHEECPAGSDTRRRLYLTRPAGSPHIVLGYCHNCQDKGVYTGASAKDHYRQHSGELEDVVLPTGEKFLPPENLEFGSAMWPTDAMAWRIMSKLTPHTLEEMGIGYDVSTHRIYLPTWDKVWCKGTEGDPELVGYQLRRLTAKGPKYLTAVKDQSVPPSTVFQPVPGMLTDRGYPVAILVEDLISGIHVARALEHTQYEAQVLVNYGTKVSPEVLHRVRDFEKAIVWLDNDSDHVLDQAHKIVKVWRMLSGHDVSIEDIASDPKHKTAEEILDVIDGHYNGLN